MPTRLFSRKLKKIRREREREGAKIKGKVKKERKERKEKKERERESAKRKGKVKKERKEREQKRNSYQGGKIYCL